MLKQIRRLIILIIGSTVLLIGLVLIVLPGPAFIVIPLGLAILGTEFLWARRILNKLKDEAHKLGSSVLHKHKPKSTPMNEAENQGTRVD